MKNIAILLIVIALAVGVASLLYENQNNNLIISINKSNNNAINNSSSLGNLSNGESSQISNIHYVNISGFAYSPSDLKIKKGEKVIWTNFDSAKHTVSSDYGNEVDSGSLDKNQKYEHVFYDTGTFSYYCEFHPYMKAKVVVE